MTKFGPEVQNTLIKIPVVGEWLILALYLKFKLKVKRVLYSVSQPE